jgi:PAS domain S-box-containing protein
MQDISRERHLDSLLEFVLDLFVEQIGATRGVLLLPLADPCPMVSDSPQHPMAIVAERNRQKLRSNSGHHPSSILPSPIPLTAATTQLPVPIIQQVVASHQTLVIRTAELAQSFAHDPYLAQQQPPAFLCTPLLNHDNLKGLLYLEHPSPGEVTADFLAVLPHLTTQIAIAIDHAQADQHLVDAHASCQTQVARLPAVSLNPSAHQERLRTEHLYRTIVQNLPTGGVALYDHEYRYLMADGPILADLGLDPKAMDGKTIWEVFPPEQASTVEALYRPALAGERITVEHPFGDRIYKASSLPILNDHGDVIMGMTAVQDITEQKQAEQELRRSEELYRALAENIPGGVVLYDQDLRFLLVNGPTFAYINLDITEITGKTLTEIFGSDVAQALTPLYQAALAGETRILEGSMAGYDYLSYYLPIRDDQGEIMMGMAIGFDITAQKQAERELRRAEELYRTLIENFPGGVTLFDRDYRYLLVQGTVVSELGLNRQDIEGKTLLEAFGTEMATIVEPQYQAVFAGEMTTIEAPFADRIFKNYAVPLRDEDNEISMGMGLSLDITAQKQAEEELRRAEALYRIVAENFPNGGITLYDRDLRYLLVDGPGIADWGLTKAEIEGKTLKEILPPELSDLMLPHYQNALAGETNVFDIDLGEMTYRLQTLPIRNEQGDVMMGMSMGQNITLQKQAEQALQRSRDELERLVGERTQQLSAANAQLEGLAEELSRSNQELEQFAYVASHDLQEPLRAISSYTQLLARRYQGQLDEKADKYIHYAVDGATRMQQLIQDLLAYSRVGRYELKPETIDSNALIQDVLTDLRVAIAENKARITMDSLPQLTGDPVQFKQLFQNLIGNALKYRTDEAPRIHISVGQSQAPETMAIVSIRDNGIGIEPQYRDRIFGIFQRLHTRKEYAGTGLGLAICKKIVERHGGQIWLESQLGQGSTFYFTLPIQGGCR